MRQNALRFFLIAVLGVWSLSAAATIRYPIKHPYVTITAPAQDGQLIIATEGQPGAIFVRDVKGAVKYSRSLGTHTPIFLTTSSRGDVYLGTASDAQDREGSARIFRLRRDLTVVWERHLEIVGRKLEMRRGAASPDGGVVIAANSAAGSLLVKLRADGEVAWTSFIDPSDVDEIHTIRATPDGGSVAGGRNQAGAWLIRVDANGKLLWQHSYRPFSEFRSLALLPDGGVLAAASGNGPGVVRIGAQGEIVWNRVWPRVGTAHSVIATQTGAAVVLTFASRMPVIALLDAGGNPQWQRVLTEQSPEFIPKFNSNDEALIAHSDRGLLFVPSIVADFLAVFDLSTGGASECAWFAPFAVPSEPIRSFVETVPVELSAPGVIAIPFQDPLPPLSLSGTNEPCTTAYPRQRLTAPSIAATSDFHDPATDKKAAARYVELLTARNFDELESIAATLRSQRSRDPMGPTRPLRRFYSALDSPTAMPEAERLDLLRSWVAAKPESTVARIALASSLLRTAWRARGPGLMNEVTETGLDRYRTLSEESRQLVDALQASAAKDAQYWSLKIQHAGEGGADPRVVARQGLIATHEPYLAVAAANYLRPEWGRSATELVDWAEEAQQILRDSHGEGDAVYAWVAHEFWQNRHVSNLKDGGFPWPRVKKGLADMVSLAPDWIPSHHVYAQMARTARDIDTARQLFKRPELDWYEGAEDVWRARVLYDNARAWALEPVQPTPPSTGPIRTTLPPTGPIRTAPVGTPAPSARPALPTPEPPPVRIPPNWPRSVEWAEKLLSDRSGEPASAFILENASNTVVVSVDATGKALKVARAASRRQRIVPLKRRTEPPRLGSDVYVVACTTAGAKCVQSIIPASLHSMNVSQSGERTYYVGVREKFAAGVVLPGSAVVDSSGAAIGVVIGKPSMFAPGFVDFVSVADLSSTVP